MSDSHQQPGELLERKQNHVRPAPSASGGQPFHKEGLPPGKEALSLILKPPLVALPLGKNLGRIEGPSLSPFA